MIDKDILESPKVDVIFGVHLEGSLKEVEINVKHGDMMADPDIFKFKVIDNGVHGAIPYV